MLNYLNKRIVSRNDTSSNWAEINPILLKGEIGIEIDTTKIKIGDGIKTWTELNYAVSSNNEASLVVVNGFNELPIEGAEDKLYKVIS